MCPEPIHLGDKTFGVIRPCPSELSLISEFELKYTTFSLPSHSRGTQERYDFDRPMMRIDGFSNRVEG